MKITDGKAPGVVPGAPPPRPAEPVEKPPVLQAGQPVRFQVLRPGPEGELRIRINGQELTAAAAKPLPPGTTGQAIVEDIGPPIRIRIDSQVKPPAAEPARLPLLLGKEPLRGNLPPAALERWNGQLAAALSSGTAPSSQFMREAIVLSRFIASALVPQISGKPQAAARRPAGGEGRPADAASAGTREPGAHDGVTTAGGQRRPRAEATAAKGAPTRAMSTLPATEAGTEPASPPVSARTAPPRPESTGALKEQRLPDSRPATGSTRPGGPGSPPSAAAGPPPAAGGTPGARATAAGMPGHDAALLLTEKGEAVPHEGATLAGSSTKPATSGQAAPLPSPGRHPGATRPSVPEPGRPEMTAAKRSDVLPSAARREPEAAGSRAASSPSATPRETPRPARDAAGYTRPTGRETESVSRFGPGSPARPESPEVSSRPDQAAREAGNARPQPAPPGRGTTDGPHAEGDRPADTRQPEAPLRPERPSTPPPGPQAGPRTGPAIPHAPPLPGAGQRSGERPATFPPAPNPERYPAQAGPRQAEDVPRPSGAMPFPAAGKAPGGPVARPDAPVVPGSREPAEPPAPSDSDSASPFRSPPGAETLERAAADPAPDPRQGAEAPSWFFIPFPGERAPLLFPGYRRGRRGEERADWRLFFRLPDVGAISVRFRPDSAGWSILFEIEHDGMGDLIEAGAPGFSAILRDRGFPLHEVVVRRLRRGSTESELGAMLSRDTGIALFEERA